MIRVREYGASGPFVTVLHGGPGAPGYMAQVAQRLGDSWKVLKPFQRGSGQETLLVARHVADLHEVVTTRCDDRPVAFVGHSWGAMLALTYAAKHPDRVASVVLIGSGTFTVEATRADARYSMRARTHH